MSNVIITLAACYFDVYRQMTAAEWEKAAKGIQDLKLGLTVACRSVLKEEAAECVSAAIADIKRTLRQFQTTVKVSNEAIAVNTEKLCVSIGTYSTALIWAIENDQIGILCNGAEPDYKTCKRISTAYQKNLETKKLEKQIESNAKQAEKLKDAKKDLATGNLVDSPESINIKSEIAGARAFATWVDKSQNLNGATVKRVEEWILSMEKEGVEFGTPMNERGRIAA